MFRTNESLKVVMWRLGNQHLIGMAISEQRIRNL
jgi:hypothetical protein